MITKNTAHLAPDIFERLARCFSNTEIVEITVASGMFNMLNRRKHAFGVTVEPGSEIHRLDHGLEIDLEALRDYYLQAARAVEMRISGASSAAI